MTSEKVTVKLSNSPETRPIAMLVQIASKFNSSVFITTGDKKINVKSIMGMMSLGLTSGKEVEVSAEGPDEAEAVAEVKAYICEQ